MWYKVFGDLTYTFKLYEHDNHFIMTSSIIKDNEEQFVSSAIINYKKSIVITNEYEVYY